MTRKDWWIGIGIVVALGLFACWYIPRHTGAAMVDGAAERMKEIAKDNFESNALADKNAATTQVGFYARAADRYRLDMKEYPTELKRLIAPPEHFKGKWDGPYMDNIALDPWDHAYGYSAPGKHNPDSFDVWSKGPDGIDGTADDIGNWESM